MADLTFFTNEEGRKLIDRFKEILKKDKFTKFDVLVGYFRLTGFYLFLDSLKHVEKMRILVGINYGERVHKIYKTLATYDTYVGEGTITKKESENNLKELIKRELIIAKDTKEMEEGIRKFIKMVQNKKIEMRMYPHSNLHAKVYVLYDPKEDGSSDFGKVITGSSNFSISGLRDELEFNVELKGTSDVKFAKERFEQLWAESVDISKIVTKTIKIDTHFRKITPEELYWKFLIEYFMAELEQDPIGELKIDKIKELKYQKDAVIEAKRKLDRFGGVFLSDVVGLGKTIIALRLAKEIGGYNCFITPPDLVYYWEEMKRIFQVAGDVYSIGKIEDIDPNMYNTIFIDEAHRFRNEMTTRHEIMRSICLNKKVVLISATPINNRPSDIKNQILLFAPSNASPIPGIPNINEYFKGKEKRLKKYSKENEYFEYMEELKKVSEEVKNDVLRHIMVRRTRADIEKFYEEDMKEQDIFFPKTSDPKIVGYEFNEELSNLFDNSLNSIISLSYARYTSSLYLKTKNDKKTVYWKNLAGIMKTLLVKRLDSSFYAFRESLKRFIESHKNFIKMYEGGTVYISKKIDVFDYLERGDIDELEKKLIEKEGEKYKSSEYDEDMIKYIKEDLKTLESLYAEWQKVNYDPKINKLKDLLIGELNEKKVIIFTESKDTAGYLEKELNNVEELKDKVISFSAASSEERWRKILKNFDPQYKEQEDTINVIITTDVLSEGVNLHRSNIIINYDIPWNPVRVIQRTGRVNRVGTLYKEIFIYNFLPVETSEIHLGLKKAAESKLEAFFNMLGKDAKYLTEDEQVGAHQLFSVINSSSALSQEDKDVNIELKYLKEVRKFRRNRITEFEKILELPQKIRVVVSDKKEIDKLVTFFGVTKLYKKILKMEKGYSEPMEINFEEAIKIFEEYKNQKAWNVDKIPVMFYEYLDANNNKMEKITEDMRKQSSLSLKLERNANKLLKEVEFCMKHAEEDNEKDFLYYIEEAIKKGYVHKNKINRLVKQLSKMGYLQDIINKKISILIKEMDQEVKKVIEDKNKKKDDTYIPEIILSLFVKGEDNEQ